MNDLFIFCGFVMFWFGVIYILHKINERRKE